LAFIGLVVATPVFFDVALVLLMPLVASVTRRSHRSLLFYALPLLAGIAVAHAFIPPTPGPVAVAGLLGADLGWVIALGLLCGIPATLIGGILWGRLISERIQLEIPQFLLAEPDSTAATRSRRDEPGFGIAFSLDEEDIGVVLLGDYWHLHAGDEVERTGRVMDVVVGDGLLGGVIDPLGAIGGMALEALEDVVDPAPDFVGQGLRGAF